MKQIHKTLTLLMMTVIILTSCHFPGQPWVLVEITSHEDGQSIFQYEEVRIVTQARSSQGIDKVELYINGELEHVDEPPMGFPLEFNADQPWMPVSEEQVILSVIAIDRRGNASEPFSITLQVVPTIDDIDTEPTPTPTVSPEELALTQTAQASCTNSATFVEHVTIPMNASVTANSNFTKIWRVNNNGTCDWAGYQVVHTSGDIMDANSPKALPVVDAGANADIVVDMIAPGIPGTYSAIWRIQAGDGNLFGPELMITINVPDLPTNTPEPTATFTATPTITPSPTSTLTPTPTSLPLSVQQYSEQISIPPNATESRTVNCPSDSVVVSGGFSHQLGVRVWHSMKNGNGWRIFATNTQPSARSLTITATCLINSGGTSDQTFTQQNAEPNDFTQLTTTCPSGSIVTGGGWVIGSNTTIQVYHSSRSGNGWQIYINNPTSNTPLINVYAVCLSGVPGSTFQEVNSENNIPPNDTGNAEKLCPSGSFVTGGGFVMDIDLTLYNTSKSQNGWINFVRNPTGEEKRLDTFAICYSP
jgi:hypothetical protein